jgi:imidazolonepropionase-like amidohydrolase
VSSLAIAVGIAAAVAGAAAAPSPAVSIVRLGRLWDGEQTIVNAVVVIRDGKVESVGRAMPSIAGAAVVDWRRYTGLPGLIDLHTHVTYYWDEAAGTRPLNQPRRNPSVTVVLAQENLRKTLDTGVTTVRDLGAANDMDYALRDLVNMGRMVGPRLFVAGQGLSAGRGGPDPAALRQAAEARVRAGSDWIKVYGSRGSFQSVDTTQTVTFDEMKAVVDASHALGHKVAIHSYGPSGVKDAVRAGADSVEHGIEIDDETFAEMVARGTVWVPTVDHNQYYVDAKDEFGFSPDAIPALRDYIDKNLAAVTRAFKAGVQIGMGSDAVYTMFGRNTRELAWFVKAGMTPAQALATATTIPARLLGQANALGKIAPGYRADLVAVEGNPLDTIDVLFTGVRAVMKDGVIVVDKRK